MYTPIYWVVDLESGELMAEFTVSKRLKDGHLKAYQTTKTGVWYALSTGYAVQVFA